jgi:hypothetical protein
MILHPCKACGGFRLGEIFCWIIFVFCFGQCAYRQCIANPTGTTCARLWSKFAPLLLWVWDFEAPLEEDQQLPCCAWEIVPCSCICTWTKTHNKIKWVGGWWFLVATAAAAVASLLLSLCLLNLITAHFLPFVLVLQREHSWKNDWMVHRYAYWNDSLVSSLLIILLSEKTQPALCLLLDRWTQVSDFPGLFFLVRADWRIQGSLYKDKSK